jgi:nicotinamidase-related amidase
MADLEILRMALVGYQRQAELIDEKIVELQAQLKGKSGPVERSENDHAPEPKRRTMSASARARIAAAQKKRWAVFHEEHTPKTAAKKPAVKTTAPKKKMSPARNAALVANLAKARAARAAKRNAGEQVPF